MLDDRERERIKAIYSKKRSAAKKTDEKNATNNAEQFECAFGGVEGFVDWWDRQLSTQAGRCAYCETSINLIAKLIDAGNLGTRRVRANGKRGKCLELERKSPVGRYEPDNCVLVCMFCNNDKSNIYKHEDYKKFFGPPRKKHFEYLAAISGIDPKS